MVVSLYADIESSLLPTEIIVESPFLKNNAKIFKLRTSIKHSYVAESILKSNFPYHAVPNGHIIDGEYIESKGTIHLSINGIHVPFNIIDRFYSNFIDLNTGILGLQEARDAGLNV